LKLKTHQYRAAEHRIEEKYGAEVENAKPRDMVGLFVSQGLTKPRAKAEAVLQV